MGKAKLTGQVYGDRVRVWLKLKEGDTSTRLLDLSVSARLRDLEGLEICKGRYNQLELEDDVVRNLLDALASLVESAESVPA